MEIALKWASVAGVSMLELWAAIPLGFALGLSAVVTCVLSAVGSILSAGIVIYLGGSLRAWLIKRMVKKSSKQSRMSRIWDKYGVIGLGFLSPLLTGAPLGAAIGVSLGAKPGKLMFWMTIGIVVWSIILTAAVAVGILSFVP
ncbi:small multi-drug export protein [Brevibacillus sp. H7]|uniref:small multi-drug export protein n=1 Tax=Brevibacillus sp. H7 TaxID=3349138 RepID=UPI00380E367B